MKKRIYFILILSGLAFNARSQAPQQMPGDSIITHPIQVMPYFIGGPAAYAAFLKANTHYPGQAIANKVEGRAIVKFVVEKDGHLSNIKLSHDPGAGLGEEAVRILQSSPKWSPGKVNNMPVRVQMFVFVNFTLPKVAP
jgi:protein TonB